ncbi:glycoside hydrolase family 3 N-terminal domain-containing protein [Sulfurimonas sp.]|uniref:glycoside hydrolase family 3 N-terminal domain-containing protein n=1 Tax=Sulfurimonas sp. TaxID=2022749 RepID=UPI002AAFA4AE|nr:glycoside hydrolase family 3 N-terminal domain-containing protein [Sulfurimonas sp.]
MKYILILLLSFLTLNAAPISNKKLKKMIGRMLVIGFEEQSVNKDTQIVKDIKRYELGGVILFDKHYKKRSITKNIDSPQQLQELTTQLKKYSLKPLLISVDQEGGNVARLKHYYGFDRFPSAKEITYMHFSDAKELYNDEAKMLKKAGINTNFAPVVDLEVNPDNKVIVGLERSYGKSSEKVTKYAKVLIDAQRKQNIISVLKHFPGHGSSLDDSHKGFVDISKTWSKKELQPYKNLIKSNDVDMIMTAHVFNSHLDKKYPATLSYKVNTKLLRKEMGYKGLIISDDLQMKAITKHYSLRQSVTLAINAGVDILLFGNQLSNNSADELVKVIYSQVKKGKISYKRIIESNKRIEYLLTKNSIKHRPISFTPKRIKLTKDYIKQHYGLKVKNIKIKPKAIVLHWTAVMKYEDCFKRLKGETLYSDRGDIAKAGALNVSTHFLVERNGAITQLMPDNWMARHVIGLNYSSIGIENVGGRDNKKDDLTKAQRIANVRLVEYLKIKYPDIKYLLGHYEYEKMQKTPLWLEKDAKYRTKKVDPGKRFMKIVRREVKYLGLKKP